MLVPSKHLSPASHSHLCRVVTEPGVASPGHRASAGDKRGTTRGPREPGQRSALTPRHVYTPATEITCAQWTLKQTTGPDTRGRKITFLVWSFLVDKLNVNENNWFEIISNLSFFYVHNKNEMKFRISSLYKTRTWSLMMWRPGCRWRPCLSLGPLCRAGLARALPGPGDSRAWPPSAAATTSDITSHRVTYTLATSTQGPETRHLDPWALCLCLWR